MTIPVSIVKCQSYEEGEVQKALRRSIDLIGGMGRFVKRGDRVLLKPNLLYGKAPEKAVTTHPALVKGIIEMVKEQGGHPQLGDSPGMGNATGVAQKSGIKKVADAMGCPIVEFKRPVLPAEKRGRVFKKIEIDQALFEADVIINLPKWKTHGQMLLTLGVKNLFGCVPGPRKALWHLRAGRDAKLFAQILVDIYLLIQPSLTILDGIVGMEGGGPGSGDPIPLGLILASQDPLYLDQIVCDLLGISRNALLTNRVAFEQGLGRDEIEVKGETIEEMKVTRFRLPKLTRVDWHLPGFLQNLIQDAIASKPVGHEEACKDCGLCVEICPPKGLSRTEKGLSFDYGKCIRCFCCQEICPEGAITVQLGWGSKILRRH